MRWIVAVAGAILWVTLIGALGGGGKPATGAQPQAEAPCSTCVWIGELTAEFTSDIHRETHTAQTDTLLISHTDSELTATELVLTLDQDASAGDVKIYALLAGRLQYNVTGSSTTSKNDTPERHCTFDMIGTVDLERGDAELTITGGTYTIVGDSDTTTLTNQVVCDGVPETVQSPLGPWFTTGDDPIAFAGGSTIEGSHPFERTVIDTDPPRTENSTTTGENTWSLSNASIEVNSTDDTEDPDIDDGACDVDLDEPDLQCTLRAAIQTANDNLDTKRITFNIEGDPTILSTSALPELRGSVEIDGATQPGAGRVTIDGAETSGVSGLTLLELANEVKGLTLVNFDVAGIYILEGGSNVIQGNLIGTNAQSSKVVGNTNGIVIFDSDNNIVGGAGSARENVIGGNEESGITIDGPNSNDNKVIGNFIGITPNDSPVPNGAGVRVLNGHHQFIGMAGEGASNIIAFNDFAGVQILGPARENVLEINVIGLTVNRAIAGNKGNGIYIESSRDNTIGSTDPANGNTIGGNELSGIQVTGATAIGNKILSNRIGALGTGALVPNTLDGIVINGSPGTIIGESANGVTGNYIGGNGRYGIYLFSPDTHDTRVMDNYLGLNSEEGSAPNGDDNIRIEDSWDNIIGAPGHANVIVRSKQDGIEIHGQNAYGNTIAANFIGNDGEVAMPNKGNGITISGASRNFVTDFNTISGNEGHGVNIMGPDAERNEITDNYIGVIVPNNGDMTRMANGEDGVLVFEASNNTIGQAAQGAPGNVISGNDGNGITIAAGSNKALSNDIVGNIIGANEGRDEAIPNGEDGIVVAAGAEWTDVGGIDPASPTGGCLSPCNLISGNTGNGIEVLGDNTAVRGNVIGLKGTIDCLDTLQPVAEFIGCQLGNGGNGVRVFIGVNTRIGSKGFANSNSCTSGCNLIAFNHTGVSVEGTARLASIVGNSIFQNLGGLPIDLGGNGPTPNDGEDDNWDGDTGPNDLRNSPTIVAAYLRQTEVVIVIDVRTVANSVSTVDFYANQGCDGAPVYLGSVLADANEDGEVFVGRKFALPPGDLWSHVSAVDEGAGNTSEVSACRALAASGSVAASAATAGQSEVQVPAIDIYKFLVGDQVQIGGGGPAEVRGVTGICCGGGGGPQSAFSTAGTNVTLTLDAPLEHDHPAGDPIVPVAGGVGEDIVWGDMGCNGAWTALDSLTLLLHHAGASPQIGAGCPEIGGEAIHAGQPVLWGDVDGSGDADIEDVLAMLRYESELDDATPRWLPGLGATARLYWQ